MKLLDKTDYKILNELITNSRIDFTDLGKKANISRENAAYRLKRLKKIGLIKSTNAVINFELLGFKQYALFLELSRLTKQKESEILNYLKSHKDISWIGILTGKWSLVLDIFAKSPEDLNEKLHFILKLFNEYLTDYALMLLDKKEYFPYKIVDIKNPKSFNQVTFKKQDKIKYDKTDLKILKILNENSRITYAELSEKLNLTANAIKRRIKELKSKNLILGYSIMFDSKPLGFEWYDIQLKLLKFDPESINNLIKFLQNHPRIVFYYKYSSGFWDFDTSIFFKNPSEIRDFINELRNKFADIVKVHDFYPLLEEITEYRLPECVFEI